MTTVLKANVFEDSGAALMARVVGNDATLVTQAAIASIDCKVFDAVAGGNPLAEPAVTVADSVFDTLQTDDRWTADSTGYNFRHDLPASALADGGKTYRVEYLFTPNAGLGEPFFVVFELTAVNLLTS